MDEFALLRRSLYHARNPEDWDHEHGSLWTQAAAIFGVSVPADHAHEIVLAAALRLPGADAVTQTNAKWEVDSPYVSRYRADAAEAAESTTNDIPIEIDRASPIGHPVSLVQCMFHGDPMRTGRGSSGGIATLLLELGNAMGEAAGGVVTLVLYNVAAAEYPFIPVEQMSDAHSIVRVPVSLSEETAYGFLLAHEHIREAVRATLRRHGIKPQIIHVRFLDDASLAAARLAQEIGAKLVTTVTPDPHRTICTSDGALRPIEADQAMEVFNKVLIGDELIARSDGVLAIGRNTLGRELLPYYPQLEDTRRRVSDGIDEGVRIENQPAGIDIPGLLTGSAASNKLNPSNLGRPTLLCVGRLAPVKQQSSLVEAWSVSTWKTHNLVVVGGDHENPSSAESQVLREISETVDSRPELTGKFCFVPAQPNGVVRSLQSYYAGRTHQEHFDAYICPSQKEEFGLSIVEAMSAGMVVCAPIRGGARTYIRHAVNGFLVDTSNPEVLFSELVGTVVNTKLGPGQITAIRSNAARTVKEKYSMEAIAEKFVAFYDRVMHA